MRMYLVGYAVLASPDIPYQAIILIGYPAAGQIIIRPNFNLLTLNLIYQEHEFSDRDRSRSSSLCLILLLESIQFYRVSSNYFISNHFWRPDYLSVVRVNPNSNTYYEMRWGNDRRYFYLLEQCSIYKKIKWPDKSTTSYAMLDCENEIKICKGNFWY